MMRLHNLRPRPGARHRVKRLGCGESSGHGKTSGKGHKGQKARSGGSIRLGFEGGQMPLIRRLPKRGFNNAAFHATYAIVNLSDLNEFKAGTVVNEELLRESKQFFVHNRASLEFIQVAQINDRVGRMKSGVIETTLRLTPNQRHLSAFKRETNAAARPRLLAFMAFAAGFSVTGAFAATKSLKAMPRAWARPQIV